MEFKEFKESYLIELKMMDFKNMKLYYVNRESLNITVYKEEVEKYSLTTSYGLSFRGKINGKMGYSYTEKLDEEAIEMLVKEF